VNARHLSSSPWRAVPVLGVTQILAWGALFYSVVLTVPLIAADRGWSETFAMGGFSLALLTAGLVSPRVGEWIDRFGGHRVMPFGSLCAALGLAALVFAANPFVYLAVWAFLGLAIAGSLYDPAFASLGRIFGPHARAPITALTLIGGFASTVSWPATHLMIESLGWRGAYLVYAAALLGIAAPLHAFALPREYVAPPSPAATRQSSNTPSAGPIFILVTAAFAAYAFVPSGLSAHMLVIFGHLGLSATAVIAVGVLFGPAQVLARVFELALGRHAHPLTIARGAVGLLICGFVILAIFGATALGASAFTILFGIGNGLLTIARGTLPLALFGSHGYGAVMGRIGGPFLIVQAAAPLALAFVLEHASDAAALATAAAFAGVALGCFLLIRRPVQPLC
jgi:MFS family permease